MCCDVLLALALLLSHRSGPSPAPQTPTPSLSTATPARAPAQAAGVLKTPETTPLPATLAPRDASPLEHLTTFDAASADLDWSSQGWRLLADGAPLKDFGRSEGEARQALRLIRELRLNQHGVIGGPTPSVEYWLSDGKAPQGPTRGLRVQPMDSVSLRVEQTQNQWVVRDDQHILFNFGHEENDARQALAVVRKYGFTQVGTVGPGSPSMMVFFTQPDAALAGEPLHSHRTARAESKRDLAEATLDPSAPAGKSLAQRSDASLNTIVSPTVPPLRQSAVTGNMLSSTTLNPDRTPFDFRQVQVLQDKGGWKLAAGSCVLADFGTDEHAARQGLSAMQYYRFTEQCQVGDASNRFTYFLVGGQAPRGTIFGMDGQPFQPDRLEVRQVGAKWAVCAGDQTLVAMGDKPEGAKEVLNLIRRQRCDRLCRLGTEGGKGMTFLVRSR